LIKPFSPDVGSPSLPDAFPLRRVQHAKTVGALTGKCGEIIRFDRPVPRRLCRVVLSEGE